MKHILNIFAKTNLAFVTFMEERGELSKNDFKKFSYIKNSKNVELAFNCYQLANEEGDSVSPFSTRQFGNCSGTVRDSVVVVSFG